MSSYLPTLAIPMDTVFVSDIIGFVLALPLALFMTYWMSAVKNRWIVVLGAFIGDVIGFLIILGWLGTLVFSTPYPGAESNGTAIFFGALFLNSVLGLSGGIIFDLFVARTSRRDYRRREPAHE
jgi:predicted membrane channel-forming protein YqfA (hemolysin III family)